MTYIQPNKNNKINFLTSILILITVFSASWGVYLYNQSVNFSHNIANQEKLVRQAEVENAELKNRLYQQIDSKNLEVLASEKSLVIEKNPEYIKLNNNQQVSINN